jgi:hypothetical protein
MKIKKPLWRLVSGFFLGLVGWVAALLHLWVFDPAFLNWGKVNARAVERDYSKVGGAAAWVRPLLASVLVFVLIALIFMK